MAQSPCFLMKPVKSVVGGQDGLISERFGISPPPPPKRNVFIIHTREGEMTGRRHSNINIVTVF